MYTYLIRFYSKRQCNCQNNNYILNQIDFIYIKNGLLALTLQHQFWKGTYISNDLTHRNHRIVNFQAMHKSSPSNLLQRSYKCHIKYMISILNSSKANLPTISENHLQKIFKKKHLINQKNDSYLLINIPILIIFHGIFEQNNYLTTPINYLSLQTKQIPLQISKILIGHNFKNIINLNQHMFLENTLTETNIKRIVNQNRETLAQYISAIGTIVSKQTRPLEQIQNLKKNYQIFIKILNDIQCPEINNYSLHFIATLSNGYIKQNRIDLAKEILKKAEAYVDSTHTDPILLTTCLNNLSSIQKIKGKHYKSLRISLKALQIMQSHLETLKLGKERDRLRQDVVVFLIVVIRCKLTLSHLLVKDKSKFFEKAYELMNYLGYRMCLKYLGQESIFIKRFTPVEKQFHLPVFKTQQKKQRKDSHQHEKLILDQLNKIHQVLKSKNNPDIIVVNSQSNIPESKILSVNQTQQSISITNQIKQYFMPEMEKISPKMPKIPLPRDQVKEIRKQSQRASAKSLNKFQQPKIQDVHQQNELSSEISLSKELQKIKQKQKQQSDSIAASQSKSLQVKKQGVPQYVSSDSDSSDEEPIIVEETIYLNKWSMKLRHERERDQNLGKLVIDSTLVSTNKKKTKNKKEEISEQTLQKIISQINFEDKLPYQFFNEQLKQDQFIQYHIIPYLDIDSEGNPSIHCKSVGLIEPFQMKIFNHQSLIFFNHVRTNLFRISISPLYSFKSVYLNIQFCSEAMLKYFSFDEEVKDMFSAIFKHITKDMNMQTPQNINEKSKPCNIINKEQLTEYLKQIITQFQNLLVHREDETSVNQVLQNELYYYKYRQLNFNKQGIYYLVRYLPGINCFDIYLQNNYQTYGIDGKVKTRGNILYKSKKFFYDFGVPLKCSFSKKKLFAYIEIIARKYSLMTFDKPLSEADFDAYIQNAILQFPITQNCFRTKTFIKNNFPTPITISLLSVNSEFPVGIKVNQYSSDQCLNRGFFIHIVPQEWVKPLRRPPPWVNKILFKTYIDQFDFRRDYFLPQWLERSGFDLLFSRIMDPTHHLYLQNNINRFIRGKCIVQIFNQRDKK